MQVSNHIDPAAASHTGPIAERNLMSLIQFAKAARPNCTDNSLDRLVAIFKHLASKGHVSAHAHSSHGART